MGYCNERLGGAGLLGCMVPVVGLDAYLEGRGGIPVLFLVGNGIGPPMLLRRQQGPRQRQPGHLGMTSCFQLVAAAWRPARAGNRLNCVAVHVWRQHVLAGFGFADFIVEE